MTARFLVLDKPAGVTSHDVVAAVRAVTGIEKVGHTGTLDPFATGVLPLALGAATKLIQFVDESLKVYDATIAFGRQTDTGDLTGETIREAALPRADTPAVEAVLRALIGDQMQTPPAYSAVKHQGKPLYWYARKGESVEVAARPITIHDVELVSYDQATLRVVITCSRGTYARVLADDIAEALGSAGHLCALQRPRSGPFRLQDALDMETLARLVVSEPGHDWREVLLSRSRKGPRIQWNPREQVRAGLEPYLRRPIDVLSHLPLAEVRRSDATRIASGGPPPPAPPGCAIGGRFLVVCGDELVAIAENAATGPTTLRVVGAA